MSEVVAAATIRLSADSSGVTAEFAKAAKSVKDLGASMRDSVAAGASDAEKAVKRLTGEIDGSLPAATNRAQRSIEAYVKSVEISANSIGKSFREQKLSDLTSRGATDDQIKRADAALRTVEAFKSQQREAREAGNVARTATALATAGLSKQADATKLTAFQTQQLGFQLHDFFVHFLTVRPRDQ